MGLWQMPMFLYNWVMNLAELGDVARVTYTVQKSNDAKL
jgi:hypothetical protein